MHTFAAYNNIILYNCTANTQLHVLLSTVMGCLFGLQRKVKRMYAVACSYRPIWGPTVSVSVGLKFSDYKRMMHTA